MNRGLLGTATALLGWAGLAFAQTEPPANDTCAGAIDFTCGQSVDLTTDTSLANNDYNVNTCVAGNSGGPDIAYRIVIPAGGSVQFTLTTQTYDASLYLISDCANPAGSCLVGNDVCNALGEVEQIMYTNMTGGSQTTFLIVDGFAPEVPGGACGVDRGTATLGGSLTCPPPPSGACCRVDATCFVGTESECMAVGGAYQGDGSSCETVDCTIGACCLQDADCFRSTSSECSVNSGNYLGSGTSCPAQCGACCVILTDGSACFMSSQEECGPTYAGDGVTCDPSPCPVSAEPSTWGRIKNAYRDSK